VLANQDVICSAWLHEFFANVDMTSNYFIGSLHEEIGAVVDSKITTHTTATDND
jgi:hypothetical protein